MERSQNIRQASLRQVVGLNLTLDGEVIEPNLEGGTVLSSSNPFPYPTLNIQSIEG